MIRIEIRFTSGQYAARPWGAPAGCGRHEWPPSPYRIVRALTAAWKYNVPDMPEERFHAVVRRLASGLPVFCLPRPRRAARGAQGQGDSPPPWRIDPGRAVHVAWPEAALASGERAALEEVAGHVHYLGRTDSWCEMRLAGDGGAGGGVPLGGGGRKKAAPVPAPIPCRVNCRPYEHGRRAGRGAVPVRVIVPKRDVAMEDVYRKSAPSDEERAGACPDGAEATAYLIDGGVAGPRPAGGKR